MHTGWEPSFAGVHIARLYNFSFYRGFDQSLWFTLLMLDTARKIKILRFLFASGNLIIIPPRGNRWRFLFSIVAFRTDTMRKLEVIASTLEDAVNAETGGA